MRISGLLVVTAVVLASRGEARADEQGVRKFVDGSVQRARRALAIGPTFGVGGTYGISSSEYDAPLSLGLQFEWFDVPVVPDPAMIYEQAVARSKDKAKERAKQMVLEGKPPPTQAELEQMAREVFEEVKAEVMGELAYRPKTIENPNFRLAFESTYLPSAGDWLHRVTLGIGVKMLSVGPTSAVYIGDANGVYLGGEAAIHILPTPSPRSPVIDLYLRVDFGVTDATKDDSQLGLGARFQLDII